MILSMREALDTWHPLLGHLFSTSHGEALGKKLSLDVKHLEPKLDKIFRALQLTPLESIKVVIIGQDPYPGGHADGLAFSSGIPHIPYSLRNIMSSLWEQGIIRTHGDLSDWAKQGVLLLNRSLTTITGHTNGHTEIGWHRITDHILSAIANHFDLYVPDKPLVVIAWGSVAQDGAAHILSSKSNFLYLKGNHPAAVKHGYIFRGGEHFIKANEWLQAHGAKPIQWGD